MEQFEYKIESLRGLFNVNKLNEYGRNRWSLIQIVSNENGEFSYIFKRKLEHG